MRLSVGATLAYFALGLGPTAANALTGVADVSGIAFGGGLNRFLGARDFGGEAIARVDGFTETGLGGAGQFKGVGENAVDGPVLGAVSGQHLRGHVEQAGGDGFGEQFGYGDTGFGGNGAYGGDVGDGNGGRS